MGTDISYIIDIFDETQHRFRWENFRFLKVLLDESFHIMGY